MAPPILSTLGMLLGCTILASILFAFSMELARLTTFEMSRATFIRIKAFVISVVLAPFVVEGLYEVFDRLSFWWRRAAGFKIVLHLHLRLITDSEEIHYRAAWGKGKDEGSIEESERVEKEFKEVETDLKKGYAGLKREEFVVVEEQEDEEEYEIV